MSLTFGPNDLLQYDARYSVLICRECQYAVQKSALRSHFLRHKIYRAERERLLTSVAGLEILEPDDVRPPDSASPPVDALPVISGYRCPVVDCEHLCASDKRMRRHLKECHQSIGGASNSTHFDPATSVKLQTFFRGTKIRYFEVTPSPPSTDIAAENTRLASTARNDESIVADDTHHSRSTSPGPRTQARSTSPVLSPPSLDLTTLKYFSYFTSKTAFTLPGVEQVSNGSPYWQSTIVAQSLELPWLMCGLLAISACHLAELDNASTIEGVHYQQSRRWAADFWLGWKSFLKPTRSDETSRAVAKAGGRVECMLQLAQWVLKMPIFDQSAATGIKVQFELQKFIANIRSVTAGDYFGGVPEKGTAMNNVLDQWSSTATYSTGRSSRRPASLSAQIDRLHTLPSRMAEALGRPRSAFDAIVIISTMNPLLECCMISFATDDINTAWRGMAKWLHEVPERFYKLISVDDPAALVLLAHWIALLVRRAEDLGCWYLKGSYQAALLEVIARLAVASSAVQGLVTELLAC